MTSVTTKTFRSGNSEAVRLPREIAYGSDIELTATRSGDVITIRPRQRKTPAEMVEEMRRIGFPSDGVQPRPEFEYPDRPGLFD
jgi:antitoxin VapB